MSWIRLQITLRLLLNGLIQGLEGGDLNLRPRVVYDDCYPQSCVKDPRLCVEIDFHYEIMGRILAIPVLFAMVSPEGAGIMRVPVTQPLTSWSQL